MSDPSTNNIEEQFNSLRTILRSDDHLKIHSSGDYERVSIKLDQDIQMTFLFDALKTTNEPLTLMNTIEHRLSKSSNKCSLSVDQWQSIRQLFDHLISSKSTDMTIIQLVQTMQDRLLAMSTQGSRNKTKGVRRQPDLTNDEEGANSSKFKGSDLIFNRILHDPTVDRSQVLIGYEDRFTGIHEIAFNEFKKVHDHEYGVPMHRIRHYKINGKVVWDRITKIDLLTGSEQNNNGKTDLNEDPTATLMEGLYQFDSMIQQWVSCPHVPSVSDDRKTSSDKDVCLPERCHMLTWNILFDYHHSSRIYTKERYAAIVETLKSLLPDVICLQEVTMPFLKLLLNQSWLHEHHYFVLVMQDILKNQEGNSYGQLLLTKNIRPRAFSFLPMDLSENAADSNSSKRLLIARFGLNAKTTIDLVNLHLHSNRSKNSQQKRCETLKNIFDRFQTKNYMLIGDFNFGDYDERETELLNRYEHDVHDLWKKTYNLEQNPGFTFDPSINICAEITSDTQIKRRFDRYLIHPLQNLSYTIEHINMIGTETIPIDPLKNDQDKRIHQSDHFALQLIIHFRNRLMSHRSALAIVPTIEHWPLIEPIREKYDSSYQRWPPHINVLWPFFDLDDTQDNAEDILLPLRMALIEQSPFAITIDGIERFAENQVIFMKADDQSHRILGDLFDKLIQLFPQCTGHRQNAYHPHLSIGQGSEEIKSQIKLQQAFTFPVKFLYILQRSHENDTEPFHITYQIPLGPHLERLSPISLPRMDNKIVEFFQLSNLYETEESYGRKMNHFKNIDQCLRSIFNDETLHCFMYKLLPYGSFRLGIDGHDVDAVFLLREQKSNKPGTDFDRQLRQWKTQSSTMRSNLFQLLENEIKENFPNRIAHYRNVDAMFPIISIVFTDETQMEIFIDCPTNDQNTSINEIHGIHDAERLLSYVRSPPVFQHVLTFVRRWAQNLGLYGTVYGYLGGYSWAILCASICHRYLSNIESLSSIEELNFSQFFDLIRNFFSTYSRMDWSSQCVTLFDEKSYRKVSLRSGSIQDLGSMRILSPSAPYQNTARTTTNSTRRLIHEGFEKVLKYLESVNTITVEEQREALQTILQWKSEFPSSTVQSLLELSITADHHQALVEWTGWIKSRLVHFFTECETHCHLMLQPSNSIGNRTKSLNSIYLLGFYEEKNEIVHRRKFDFSLKKFLDQCILYSARQESMTLQHRLIDIGEWKLEQMEPKAQRIRK